MGESNKSIGVFNDGNYNQDEAKSNKMIELDSPHASLQVLNDCLSHLKYRLYEKDPKANIKFSLNLIFTVLVGILISPMFAAVGLSYSKLWEKIIYTLSGVLTNALLTMGFCRKIFKTFFDKILKAATLEQLSSKEWKWKAIIGITTALLLSAFLSAAMFATVTYEVDEAEGDALYIAIFAALCSWIGNAIPHLEALRLMSNEDIERFRKLGLFIERNCNPSKEIEQTVLFIKQYIAEYFKHKLDTGLDRIFTLNFRSKVLKEELSKEENALLQTFKTAIYNKNTSDDTLKALIIEVIKKGEAPTSASYMTYVSGISCSLLAWNALIGYAESVLHQVANLFKGPLGDSAGAMVGYPLGGLCSMLLYYLVGKTGYSVGSALWNNGIFPFILRSSWNILTALPRLLIGEGIYKKPLSEIFYFGADKIRVPELMQYYLVENVLLMTILLNIGFWSFDVAVQLINEYFGDKAAAFYGQAFIGTWVFNLSQIPGLLLVLYNFFGNKGFRPWLTMALMDEECPLFNKDKPWEQQTVSYRVFYYLVGAMGAIKVQPLWWYLTNMNWENYESNVGLMGLDTLSIILAVVGGYFWLTRLYEARVTAIIRKSLFNSLTALPQTLIHRCVKGEWGMFKYYENWGFEELRFPNAMKNHRAEALLTLLVANGCLTAALLASFQYYSSNEEEDSTYSDALQRLSGSLWLLLSGTSLPIIYYFFQWAGKRGSWPSALSNWMFSKALPDLSGSGSAIQECMEGENFAEGVRELGGNLNPDQCVALIAGLANGDQSPSEVMAACAGEQGSAVLPEIINGTSKTTIVDEFNNKKKAQQANQPAKDSWRQWFRKGWGSCVQTLFYADYNKANGDKQNEHTPLIDNKV